MKIFTQKIYGILCTCFITIISLYLQNLHFWPFTLSSGVHPLEAVMIALILGVVISAIFKLPKICEPGIKFSGKQCLNLSVILLGAKLSIDSILQESYKVIIIIIIFVFISFIITILFCKLMKINFKLAILIAVGTSVCGSSAIAVAAPVIEADDHEIGLSIAVINILGLIAIFAFPALSVYFALSYNNAGIWMGLSIQAVAQTVAAGFSYNSVVGGVAVIVKLARVLLLAPMIVLISIWFKKKKAVYNNTENIKDSSFVNAPKKSVWFTYVPPFILFFILLMILNSLGLVKSFNFFGYNVESHKVLENISGFLMAMALAGIGLNTDLKKMFRTGLKPLVVSSISALILAVLAFILVKFFI